MSDSVTWILTADDWNAQIHVSRHGSSTLLHTIRNRIPERIVRRAETADGESADFAQFRTAAGLPAERPRDTHLCFAHELLWLLGEGASTGAYDGLIIMATPAMMEALNSIASPASAERVIARIVMSAPIGNPLSDGSPEPVRESRSAPWSGATAGH